MKKNLLSFLFLESADSDAAAAELSENLEQLFEAAAEIEKGELGAKKTPLTKALSEFGIDDADLQLDPEGFCLFTNDRQHYIDVLNIMGTPEAMHKLAEMGWVVTKLGDGAMTNEPAEYRVRFFEIATVDTGGKDKSSEKALAITKKAREFATTELDRDDDLNPVENEDDDMGKRQVGVGKAKDGADPEGKPKGSEKKVKESLNEMTSTGSMGTVEGGPQGIVAPGIIKKPKPYGKGTKFAMPGQWKVKQPIVNNQVKRHPRSESLGAGVQSCPQQMSAEEFLNEPLPEGKLAPATYLSMSASEKEKWNTENPEGKEHGPDSGQLTDFRNKYPDGIIPSSPE